MTSPHSSIPLSPVGLPQEKEEVFFEGSPSLKGEVGTLCLCVGIAGVLLGGGIATVYFAGSVYWWLIPIALLAGVIAIAYPVLLTRLRRYKITSYRIDYERGLLSKSIDTLELWRVDDIQFQQSLFARILGVGTLTIVSNDASTPQLVLPGLPNSRQLFELLKQRIDTVKRQRGVLKLDT